jgi:hypothetical protein
LFKAKNPNPTGDLSLPGAIVEAQTADSVLFLIRGGHLSRRDRVPTFHLGTARFAPQDSLPLGANADKRWRLSASEGAPIPESDSNEKSFDIELHYRASGTAQVLSTSFVSPGKAEGEVLRSSAEIPWVGDLDGDGRLDLFIFDDTSETGSRGWTLYLSGNAKGNELLGKAAEFSLPGC